MDPILNFIDGRLVAPIEGAYLNNYGPRNGQIIGMIADSTAADIDAAVTAASRAFPKWKRLSRSERAAFLYRIADRIEARIEDFANAESLDQGKPVHLARQVDIPRAIENFRFFAGAILHQQEKAFRSSEQVLNYTRRDPIGVAGLISPWNLPLYLLTWKVAPALATGNTIVAKPSELTSLTASLLAAVIKEADLPKGVCNFVFGRGSQAGDALVGHPKVPLISFTGGTATAEAIGRRAAPLFKKMSLELGGKNPAVIFADCDLEAAVATTIRSSFTNQGEICLCTSRLLIEESIFDRFTSLFIARVKTLKVGDPRLTESFMGPLVSAGHREKVIGFVARAKAQGLKVLAGGETMQLEGELAGGYYYPPTVLIAPDTEAEIMQQEVFGPVVTLTPFRGYDDAIVKANSTRYGLACTVWTKSLDTAHNAAADIEAGLVWINSWMLRDLRTPFGGVKDSGVGREGGDYSLDFYTEEKNICLQLSTPRD